MLVQTVLFFLAVAAPLQENHVQSGDTALVGIEGNLLNGSDMMNGGASTPAADGMPLTGSVPAVREPPPKVGTKIVTIEAPNNMKRKFEAFPAANCKNRAYIMSSYLRRTTQHECQTKCASDKSCTGYNIEVTGQQEGECTLFHGKCDLVNDSGHDLFLEREVDNASAPPVELPVQKPAAPPPAPAASGSPKDPMMLNITIVIPTVRRFQKDGSPAPERYLGPLVQKMWGDLAKDQQQNVKFLILNSDKEPEKHVEALNLASIPGVKVLTRPNWHDDMEKKLKATGAIKDNNEAVLEDGRKVNQDWIKWVASEDLDGAYLLELGMNMSPYILFLEDDVWPTTKSLEKLTKFVRSMKTDDWLFIDLYTPNLNWAEGMLNVKNAERYPFQCCTQAMLFRSDRVAGIISYWRSHSNEPVDDNLRNYRQQYTPDLYVYAARPNLFEHIGAYSSNPQKSTGVIEHQSIDFVPLLFQTNATATAVVPPTYTV